MSRIYEVKVVKYLNKSMIDFDWQIPFKRRDGKVYFCDLYIKKDNLYVEIKGHWMQEISKRKWKWFHRKYPNSKLWDQKKLRSMGIL